MQILARPFNAFLNWYGQHQESTPYRTNLLTDATTRVGSDFMTQVMRWGKIADFEPLGAFLPMSAYYGLETPAVLKLIDSKISNKTFGSRLMRTSAMMLLYSPMWTVRHQFFVNVMHGNPIDMSIVTSGLALWATTTPIIFPMEHVVQNRVPLKYRFLAQNAIIFMWQVGSTGIAVW